MSAASGSSYARNTLWSSSNGVHHKFSKSKAIVSLGFTLHGPSCTMQTTATWLLQTKRHSCYTTLSSQNLPQQLEVDWLYLEILENKKNNLPCKLTKHQENAIICESAVPWLRDRLHWCTCDTEASWKNNTDNQWDTSYDDQENKITNEKTW